MTHDIRALVVALDDPDEQMRRRAGDTLLRIGRRAAPELIDALKSTSIRTRQSSAFLLGRIDAPGAGEALAAALADAEPKVRKNVAVALGRAGGEGAAQALLDALARETVDWVRPSLVLAVGALSGANPGVHTALASVAPQSDEERAALQKALDRAAPEGPAAVWSAGGWRPQAFLDVPIGLEHVARDEAAALGMPPPEREEQGLLRLAPEIAPDGLLERLRCCYAVLLEGGAGPALPLHDPRACASAVEALMLQSKALQRWREWVIPGDGGPLRFRLGFGPRTRADVLRGALEGARRAAAALGMSDSPSRYTIELLVTSGERGARLRIRPAFSPDARFSYRVRDVPAAINPTVAACLARLVQTRLGGVVFDPTCGSGTLLVERAHLGAARLVGLDQAPGAVEAARANLAAAGLRKKSEVRLGDATNSAIWPECDEVIANLPFGQRTRHTEGDLDSLYRSLPAHIARSLRPGGRALLYTNRPDPLVAALKRERALRTARRMQVQSGGMTVEVLVVERREG